MLSKDRILSVPHIVRTRARLCPRRADAAPAPGGIMERGPLEFQPGWGICVRAPELQRSGDLSDSGISRRWPGADSLERAQRYIGAVSHVVVTRLTN